MAQQKGFFDEDFRLEKINKQGDPLWNLDEFIYWEMFRPILEKAFSGARRADFEQIAR